MARYHRAIIRGALGAGAALWLVVLVSWIVSWQMPHGWYLTGERRYGIWCERGFAQLRLGVRSELRQDGRGGLSVVVIQYGEKGSTLGGDMRAVTWGRGGPFLSFRGWTPLQTAEFLRGGETQSPDGTTLTWGDHIFVWAVPHYVLAIVLALPTGIFVVRLSRTSRTRRRRAKGLCLRCGYDLRATPDLCPECGATAEQNEARPRIIPAA